MKLPSKKTLVVLELVLLTIIATTCLASLVDYVVDDYKQQLAERQLILEDARYYKTHPLVLNGCETDLECERLDEMLDVIHTSYTLD